MIRVEIAKLLRRPRTWVSVFLLCLLPAIVAVFLALTDVAPRPGEGPAFLSSVLANGKLYPAAALGIVLPIFLPIAVCVLAGDAVAGEATAGTLRYLLLRPVSRSRLLVGKLLSVITFTLLAVTAVALTALAIGVKLFPPQPGALPVTVSGTPLTGTEIFLRTVFTILFIGWSMLGVASIALFLSTLVESSLGAALGALAFLIASTLLLTLDAAASLQPYLPTRYWLSFVDLFRDPILWRDLVRGVLLQGVYVLVFLAAAWANFTTKDITS